MRFRQSFFEKSFPDFSSRQFSSESLPLSWPRGILAGWQVEVEERFWGTNDRGANIDRRVHATVMSVMSFASERAPEEDREIDSFSAGAEPVLSSKNLEN